MSNDDNKSQAWNIAIRITSVTIIPWVAWATVQIFSLKSFANRGDRFSASDGYRIEKLILEESNKLRQMLHSHDIKLRDYEKEFSESFIRHTELDALLRARENNNR